MAGEYLVRLAADRMNPVEFLEPVEVGKGSAGRPKAASDDRRLRRHDARGRRGISRLPPGEAVPAFLIDKYEVTNAGFLNFVAAGGYRDQTFWPETLIVNGKPSPWAEALKAFVDRTGLPGPRSWSGGSFPEGKGDHPVVGVSWYEATAYARWLGKELPTREQWWRAALGDARGAFPWGNDVKTAEVRANFGLVGTRPVGSYPLGVSPFGCFDMAGNVREWLRDPAPDGALRSVVGGSWEDPAYMFELSHMESFDPAFANQAIGFRLVRPVPGTLISIERKVRMKRLRRLVLLLLAVGAAMAPPAIAETPAAADAWLAKPVDDQTFQTYLEFFAYDKKLPFDLRVIDTEEKDGVKREHLSFQSTRGVRVFAHLYRPAASASRQLPSAILLHGGGPAGKDNPSVP